MADIETLRGAVPSTKLGPTLMHEHIFVLNSELLANYPPPSWDEDAAIADAVAQLERLHRNGITTLVDLTVPGLGRDITRIIRVSQLTSINIIAATGWYTRNTLPSYYTTHGPGRKIDIPDPLEAMFIRDLEHGIASTPVKAAMIKVVTDAEGLTADVERIMYAAARAAKATGAPITTHSNAAEQTGRLQQDYFRRQGVDLERIVIGHSGDTSNLDYLRELMDNGSTIGLDRFGMDLGCSFEERIDVVMELATTGYADRIVLSHDAAVFSMNTEPAFRASTTPDWNFDLVPGRVVPELRRRGLPSEILHQMMVTNPERVLTRRS